MVRTSVLIALMTAASPALANCPAYMSADHCNYFYGPPQPRPELQFNFEPSRRSYAPTYVEPEPPRRFNEHDLDRAIRQIPNYDRQFPNYGR